MANRNIKDVKRFVDGVSKEVAEKAYNGGGGSTYTAGNGITITEENVINADTKVITNAIDSLTDEQCEALNIGDVVISSNTPYVVNYKQKGTGSLSHSELDLVKVTNHEIINIRYTKSQGSSWQYMDTTEKNLDLFNLVFLRGTNGTITDVDDISAIVDRAYIMRNYSTILLPTYAETISGGTVYHYSSVMYQDNTYLECEVFVSTEGAEASYNVETKTIRSGSSIHYAYLKCYDTDGNQHDLTFLCGNASISTYDELAEYLINSGFTEGEISSGQYSNIGLPVTDAGDYPVYSMQASVSTSSGEISYDIYCHKLVISSGEISRNSIYLDSNNSFAIFHLT